jgi:hypothetical protein
MKAKIHSIIGLYPQRGHFDGYILMDIFHIFSKFFSGVILLADHDFRVSEKQRRQKPPITTHKATFLHQHCMGRKIRRLMPHAKGC